MNHLGLFALASVSACVAAAGCTFKPHGAMGAPGSGGVTGGGSGGATEVYDAPPLSDAPREYVSADADTEAGPTVDANCQNQPFTVIAPPPNLLILLDRSGSMAQNAMGMNCGGGRGGGANCGVNSKWAQVTTAINQVVSMTETTINWGLKFFGSTNACAVAAGAAVAPGPNNAAAIAAAIAAPANQPGSNTPTRAGVLSAGEYLATVQDANPKFVLLATDGQPNCAAVGGDDMVDDAAAIEAVNTVKAMNISTFVIGIATGMNGDATLNAMAVNGGYPRVGAAQQYYSVTTTADLVAALGTIQTIATGMCTYPLGPPGPNTDMSKATVTVDGVPSVKDASDGWHFDPGMTSITFTGPTCEKLMMGALRSVQVLFGCKIVVI